MAHQARQSGAFEIKSNLLKYSRFPSAYIECIITTAKRRENPRISDLSLDIILSSIISNLCDRQPRCRFFSIVTIKQAYLISRMDNGKYFSNIFRFSEYILRFSSPSLSLSPFLEDDVSFLHLFASVLHLRNPDKWYAGKHHLSVLAFVVFAVS